MLAVSLVNTDYVQVRADSDSRGAAACGVGRCWGHSWDVGCTLHGDAAEEMQPRQSRQSHRSAAATVVTVPPQCSRDSRDSLHMQPMKCVSDQHMVTVIRFSAFVGVCGDVCRCLCRVAGIS